MLIAVATCAVADAFDVRGVWEVDVMSRFRDEDACSEPEVS